MSRVLFIHESEDIDWLFDTALKCDNVSADSGTVRALLISSRASFEPFAAVVYGNEDCPERIEVYGRREPKVGDEHIEYRLNSEGKYEGAWMPKASVRETVE